MTTRQYNRLRKWEKRVQPAYSAGVMDGMDMAFIGEPKPHLVFEDYDVKFYVRPFKRRTQEVVNAAVARNRGKVDGWECADAQLRMAEEDDWIEEGIARLEYYANRQAA